MRLWMQMKNSYRWLVDAQEEIGAPHYLGGKAIFRTVNASRHEQAQYC